MVTAQEAIVLSCVGGRYQVFRNGATLVATIRGRMKHAASKRVLVGDRVTIHVHDDGSATIEGVEPRHSTLQRRSPGRASGVRAVAANVDQVVVVGAASRPDWDPHLIDRFIAVAEANALQSVVVVNKADLHPDPESHARPYRDAGYETRITSAVDGRGIEGLRALLDSRVTLFTGGTGTGKSSLLNALQPGLHLRTATVSRRAGSGRHTTVAAEMHALTGGGFVVDTPGLRDIGLWGVSPGDVAAAFPEFQRFSPLCRFDNCRHVSEPGCAVVSAVERKELSETRLSSYRRLLEEAARASQPWL